VLAIRIFIAGRDVIESYDRDWGNAYPAMWCTLREKALVKGVALVRVATPIFG
jgi:hypothetical protein